VSGIVHDFRERLEWSQDLSAEASWADLYRRIWPDLLACVAVVDKCEAQKAGIDRIITLQNGRQFFVDEKKRDTTYDDVLLEICSVAHRFDMGARVWHRTPRDRVGWTLDADKRCDYVVYAIPRRGLVYVLPFDLLRRTLRTHYFDWTNHSDWWPKPARNNGYTTVNMAIPWDVLRDAMAQEMRDSWNDGIELPVSNGSNGQMAFEWGA